MVVMMVMVLMMVMMVMVVIMVIVVKAPFQQYLFLQTNLMVVLWWHILLPSYYLPFFNLKHSPALDVVFDNCC